MSYCGYLFAAWLLLLPALHAIPFADHHSRGKTDGCPNEIYALCPCGNTGDTISVPVKMCFDKAADLCIPCNLDYLEGGDPCHSFENCTRCDPTQKGCLSCPKGRSGRFCEINSPSLPLQSIPAELEVPIFIEIPAGQPIPDDLRILRRARDTCRYPEVSPTANIACTVRSSSISCTQECVWGYTFPGTNKRTINCEFDRDRWIPSGFKECEPYVNCDLKIVAPGDMKCTAHNAKKPVSCSIECLSPRPVPRRDYVCNTDGSFSPPLPNCVDKDWSIRLVDPPVC